MLLCETAWAIHGGVCDDKVHSLSNLDLERDKLMYSTEEKISMNLFRNLRLEGFLR